jgi:hypothetical protein
VLLAHGFFLLFFVVSAISVNLIRAKTLGQNTNLGVYRGLFTLAHLRLTTTAFSHLFHTSISPIFFDITALYV